MPAKHIISPGLGFSPGSVKYIVTRGLLPADQGVIIPFDLDVIRSTAFDFDVTRSTAFDFIVNLSAAFNLDVIRSTAFNLDVNRTIAFDLEIG